MVVADGNFIRLQACQKGISLILSANTNTDLLMMLKYLFYAVSGCTLSKEKSKKNYTSCG